MLFGSWKMVLVWKIVKLYCCFWMSHDLWWWSKSRTHYFRSFQIFWFLIFLKLRYILFSHIVFTSYENILLEPRKKKWMMWRKCIVLKRILKNIAIVSGDLFKFKFQFGIVILMDLEISSNSSNIVDWILNSVAGRKKKKRKIH